jgi:hypothetical protein
VTTLQQNPCADLPSDWAFDRLPPRAQLRLLADGLNAELQRLRRGGQQPSYWQRLQLKQAIDLFAAGYFGSSLTRLREARRPAPPELPQVEKAARRWTLSFLEHALKEAEANPRRRPRGA